MTHLIDPDSRFFDERNETKASKALSDKAYASAFDAAADQIAAAPKMAVKLARMEGKMDQIADLERQVKTLHASIRDLRGKLPTAAKAKPAYTRPRTLDVLTSACVAEFLRRAHQVDPTETIKRMHPSEADKFVRDAVTGTLKSGTEPASPNFQGWASELVQTDTRGFWKDMPPTSILGEMVRRGYLTPMDFGVNNAITVPRRAETDRGSLRPMFFAPGATIPVKTGKLSSVTIARHQMGIISVISEELAQTSLPNIRTVIADMIADDISEGTDVLMWDSEFGAPTLRPPGLLNGITPTSSVDIATDLKVLVQHLVSIRARTPVIMMDPMRVVSLRMERDAAGWIYRDELDRSGTIFGVPVIVSANVTDDMLIAVDCAALMLGSDVPKVDNSSHATLVMVDDLAPAPTMDGTLPGSIQESDAAAAGATVISTYQTNAEAIRTILPITWASMGATSTAYISGVAW